MNTKSLLEIEKSFFTKPKKVVIKGTALSIPEILSVARSHPTVSFTTDKKVLNGIKKAHEVMIEQVKKGVPIYGCNTGYGERASVIVNQGTAEERLQMARKVSEGISHIDVSVGPEFSSEVVRAAMLIRINMLTNNVSAVKLADLEIYKKMLNAGITPVVNQYGGIGASGDLAHNSRVVSAARQLPGTLVRSKEGEIGEAQAILSAAGIKKLEMDPKAGLGLVNGDNFSTALAALLAADTVTALLLSFAIGAMSIEVLMGTDRSFHQMLAMVRPHQGQQEVSAIFRHLLSGSKLAFQEMNGHVLREKGVKVQDGYSLRCLAQYHAVNVEKIKQIIETITINANSVSDNPLWVPPEMATENENPWQWVSGGNFIAMHMVESMDSLRKTLTQITKLNDRHLGRLVSPIHNNGLPANLSDKDAITACAFKGVQVQSGMFDVYSSLLSIPVSTFFGVHEEGNQDITSHALTSGILGLENLRVTRYSLAQQMLAVHQGVLLRGGVNLLSPKTKPLFNFIHERVEYVKKERPLHNEIESLYQAIVSGEVNDVLLKVLDGKQ